MRYNESESAQKISSDQTVISSLKFTICRVQTNLTAQVLDPNILNDPSKILQSVSYQEGRARSVAVKTDDVQISKLVDLGLLK